MLILYKAEVPVGPYIEDAGVDTVVLNVIARPIQDILWERSPLFNVTTAGYSVDFIAFMDMILKGSPFANASLWVSQQRSIPAFQPILERRKELLSIPLTWQMKDEAIAKTDNITATQALEISRGQEFILQRKDWELLSVAANPDDVRIKCSQIMPFESDYVRLNKELRKEVYSHLPKEYKQI